MAKYLVNWERHPGRFHLLEGDVVELTAEEYDYIIHDADGILTRVPDETPLVDATEIEDPTEDISAEISDDRAEDAPAQDRMVKQPKRKRERRPLNGMHDPESGSQGPMTKADWGAKRG